MNLNKAKLKFLPNNFEIIEEGDHVVFAWGWLEGRAWSAAFTGSPNECDSQ